MTDPDADWIDPEVWPHAAALPEMVAAVADEFAQVIDSVRRGGGNARALASLAVETLVTCGALPEAGDTDEEWLITYVRTDPDGSRPLEYDITRSERAVGTFTSRAEAEGHVAAWAAEYAGRLAFYDVRYHRRVRWTGPWALVE